MSQSQITTTGCCATSDSTASTDTLPKTENTNQPLDVGEGEESKSLACNMSESEISKREKKELDEIAPNVSDDLKQSELDVMMKKRLVLSEKRKKERKEQRKDKYFAAQLAARRKSLLSAERIAEIESQMRLSARAAPRCIEIRNVPEVKNEDPDFVPMLPRKIASILKFKLHRSDVLYSTRVPFTTEGCFFLRPVVVEFRSRGVRDEFLAATLAYNERAIDARSVLNIAQLGIRWANRQVFVAEVLQTCLDTIYTSTNVEAERVMYRLTGKSIGQQSAMRGLEKLDNLLFKSYQKLNRL